MAYFVVAKIEGRKQLELCERAVFKKSYEAINELNQLDPMYGGHTTTQYLLASNLRGVNVDPGILASLDDWQKKIVAGM